MYVNVDETCPCLKAPCALIFCIWCLTLEVIYKIIENLEKRIIFPMGIYFFGTLSRDTNKQEQLFRMKCWNFFLQHKKNHTGICLNNFIRQD